MTPRRRPWWRPSAGRTTAGRRRRRARGRSGRPDGSTYRRRTARRRSSGRAPAAPMRNPHAAPNRRSYDRRSAAGGCARDRSASESSRRAPSRRCSPPGGTFRPSPHAEHGGQLVEAALDEPAVPRGPTRSRAATPDSRCRRCQEWSSTAVPRRRRRTHGCRAAGRPARAGPGRAADGRRGSRIASS